MEYIQAGWDCVGRGSFGSSSDAHTGIYTQSEQNVDPRALGATTEVALLARKSAGPVFQESRKSCRR